VNFRQENSEEEITLEMTPLIDMVFQLLIFFLITTTFAVNVKEGGLELDLPKAKSSQISSLTSHLVIAVLKDGRAVIGGEVMSDQDLKNKLAAIQKEKPNTLVVVQADRLVPHYRVVNVMDIAATLGLKRMAIATVTE
jgi:biopolymer transport protein ExbD